ncbi:MAG: radical SAM protein [Candidatus Brocadia sp.]|nr:radical SAM protein [Candidatus Brocadia sp.]
MIIVLRNFHVGMKDMLTNPGAKPRINTPWRIRNDKTSVIVYKCVTDTLTHKVLTPVEATLLPFLDGTFTLSDIEEAWSDALAIADKKEGPHSNLFQSTLTHLISHAGIVTFDGEPSPSFRETNQHLFPDFSSYQYPLQRLARPISVNIAITNRCGCDCMYCYAERRTCDEADFERLKDIFCDLSDNEIFMVDITGGDIFTRKDVLRILTEMVKREFVFFLSTKSFLSEETASRLKELGIGIPDPPPHLRRDIQVSIDSPDTAVAEMLTRSSRYVENATETIKNLIAAGLTPRVKCVLTSYNFDAPDGLVRLFSNLGVTNFQFVQYGRSHYRHDDALFLTHEQKLYIKEAIERIREKHPSVSITAQDDTSVQSQTRKNREDWDRRSICSGGRVSMLIQPNGDVTLCDQIPHAENHIVGNVFEKGVAGVWNSPKLYNFLYPSREQFNGTVCYTCSEFDLCHKWQGYCYRDSLFYFGTLLDAPPDCPRQTKTAPRQI